MISWNQQWKNEEKSDCRVSFKVFLNIILLKFIITINVKL